MRACTQTAFLLRSSSCCNRAIRPLASPLNNKREGRMLEQTDKQRLEIQAVILERLADLVQVNPQAAAISLANASLVLLAKTFPTLLSAQDQQRIQQNIPGVTPGRMAERA